MFKKKMLTIVFLGTSAMSFNASATLTTAEIIDYFDFGYRRGMSPLLWPTIPALAQGAGLTAVPQSERTAVYLLGAAGVTTGLSVLALAVYGAYKLLIKNKETQNSTK